MTDHKSIIEQYEERAAIMEFDGGLSRSQAEFSAYMELRKIYGVQNLPRELVEKHLARYRKQEAKL